MLSYLAIITNFLEKFTFPTETTFTSTKFLEKIFDLILIKKVLRGKESGVDSFSPGDENFLLEIHESGWFDNLQLVLSSARYAVNIVFNNQKNVLIHCSDGWFFLFLLKFSKNQ